MAQEEDRSMPGELTISYSRGNYHVSWTEGYRKTGWDFTAEEFSPELLKDILQTVAPQYTGPAFVQPQPIQFPAGVRDAQPVSKEDVAAREAEWSLRNGGAALGPNGGGVGIDAPAYDDNQLRGLPLPGDWRPPTDQNGNPVDMMALGRAIANASEGYTNDEYED